MMLDNFMGRDKKVFVAGHRGLVGSALVRRLRAGRYENLLLRSHRELDLADSVAVAQFFESERPEYVFLAAAKVGGILANSRFPGDFIFQNLSIQTNVIHNAYRCGVTRLIFMGSSCIYPKHAHQPISEDCLLTGPLEPTNKAYAVAKIAGIEMCASYNRQFGTSFLAVMPTNLYGPGDNYDLDTSHVVPALMRKMHEAKLRNTDRVEIWGTGTPRREFLHSDDLADACVFLMNLADTQFRLLLQGSSPLVNIGYGDDVTIRELSELLAQVVGFRGKLQFDSSKPDGTPRKLLDVSKLSALGWQARIPLREGLERTYQEFQQALASL